MADVFHHGRLALSYEKYGTGEHLIVFLHGYGKSRKDFHDVCLSLSDSYSAVSIDLPFHGDSENAHLFNVSPLKKKEWNNWMSAFIDSHGNKDHSLVAFSIGARMALCYSESEPLGLKKVILLAPDGFIVNPWNIFFTGNKIGKSMFRWAMSKDELTDGLVRLMATLRFLDAKRKKIIEDNIKGSDAKTKLFQTWVFLRYLWPDRKWIKDIHGPAWHNMSIYLGKHDSVIPFEQVKAMIPAEVPSDVLRQIHVGHDMMNERIMRILEEEIRVSFPTGIV